VLEFDMNPSKMDKTDDRHLIAWVEFQRITKIEKGRPFHSQLAERAVNKMNPNAKKGNKNEKAELMGIKVAADDQFAAERAKAAYNVSEERDFAKRIKAYGLEMSADEVKAEYAKAQRESSSWKRPGQTVKTQAYRVRSRKMISEQIRIAKARIESQTTPEALEELAKYQERVQREKLTRMDVDTASQKPKLDQMQAELAKANYTGIIPTTYIPSTEDPAMPQSAKGTWDLSKAKASEMGGDSVLKFTTDVAITEVEMRPDLEEKLKITLKRFGPKAKTPGVISETRATLIKRLIEYNGGPILKRLCDSDGGRKWQAWMGERKMAIRPPLPPTPAAVGTQATITPSPVATTIALPTNTPLAAAAVAEEGGGDGEMEVEGEGEGEGGSTTRKSRRGDDGVAIAVVTGQHELLSPARVGTSGKGAQRSSPDRD